MSERETIDKVVTALRKVPKKELLIIELANRVCTEDGQLDYDELEKIQPEVNLAVAEAKMYGAYTVMAVNALQRLPPKGKKEDVGP
jgi:hypothetical protein